MPGTLVRDALAPNLLTGVTLTAAGTTSAAEVTVDRPEDVTFVLETGTVTGTSPTLDVTIQGSDVSGFGSGVRTFGQFELSGGAQSANVKYLTTYVDTKYVRAVVVIAGTTPVYTGTTVTPRQKHDRRTRSNSA